MRVALAQLNYKIGDFENNFKKIESAIHQASLRADCIVFSELCLTGYYPSDLISKPGFVEHQNLFIEKIKTLSLDKKIDIIIGVITKNTNKGKSFYNSLVMFSKGERIYTYHKRLLPVYNIFNEARHFSPGKTPGIVHHQDCKIGFLICEDGWAGSNDYSYECDPVDDLEKQSLDLIVCINGSPSNIGKEEERLKQFQNIAKRCDAPLVFVNQVGGNDDIVFDGSSFIIDKDGQLKSMLPAFEEALGYVDISSSLPLQASFPTRHFLTTSELFYQQTILGLQDYVKKCGFRDVVIGVSGGMDSAMTLALAVKALGAERVHAIAMPARYSSTSSLEDAKVLCNNFGVTLHVYSIDEELELALTRFQSVFHTQASSLTEQNIQARLRGRLLMEFSNQNGALVLSTGNKSELSVGYTTLYGDMTGGFNLIGDLYKTEIYDLAHYFNHANPQTLIPKSIFSKAPSAELAPNQKDSDTLPDYPILDPILKLYIEGDLLSPSEKTECEKAIANIDHAIINRVHSMVDKAEFKRRQSAPIVRVQRRAFGYGRQFPIAANYCIKN